METKDVDKFTNMEKNGLGIKNTPCYIKYADAKKKSPFYENVLDLTSFSEDFFFFFLWDFNSCDLIS